MAAVVNNSSRSSLFVNSPGKARATIPGHGVNADGSQGVGGFLNKKGKPVSSPTNGNKAKRYFKRSVFKSNGPETNPTCSTNSCFQSFKNRFSVDRRACRLSRPFKTFSTQLAENYSRSCDPRRGAGLQTRIPLTPNSRIYSKSPTVFARGVGKNRLEVATLLEKGALNMVKPVLGQFLSSLFLVPKRDGNSRPLINLKELNVFLKYDHFKMEGIHLVRDLLQPQDWLGKIDLKDAYFVIPV